MENRSLEIRASGNSPQPRSDRTARLHSAPSLTAVRRAAAGEGGVGDVVSAAVSSTCVAPKAHDERASFASTRLCSTHAERFGFFHQRGGADGFRGCRSRRLLVLGRPAFHQRLHAGPDADGPLA